MVHRVAVLALDDVKPFDLGVPGQVLGQVGVATGRPAYEVSTCSLGGRPVRTTQDFRIETAHDESLLAAADTVVVPTQNHEIELPGPGGLSDELATALATIPASTRVVSLCTSAYVLAAAGMLDGLAATTHWMLCADFARRFPRVEVRPDVLFVDNGRVLTAAGAAAGIDLCLHLVRRDHGADVANAAARRSVVAPWRDGGQAQFIEHTVPVHEDSSTVGTRTWVLERIGVPVTLDEMARHALMSKRTFTRRFRAETGLSPHRWLIAQRVDQARRLLESTELSIGEIAAEVGFGDPLQLRKHLRTVVGLAPNAYRRTYSVTTPPPADPRPAAAG